MVVLYIAIAVITSGFSAVFYKYASDASKNSSTSAFFPTLWFLPLSAVFGVIAYLNGELSKDLNLILPAILGGVAIFACAFTLLESMKRNAFSITVIIVNLSFIFPILLSIIFLNESAHPLQLIGMAIAIGIIVFMNLGQDNKDSEDNEARSNNRKIAIILALIASFGNGAVDFAIKIQQTNMNGTCENAFFFYVYLFAAIAAVITSLVMRRKNNKLTFNMHKKQRIKLAYSCPLLACCNGLCFLAISLLADKINAAAEFTIVTTLSIVVSLVYGCLAMRVKLKKRDIISIVFCLIAIACQCLNIV